MKMSKKNKKYNIHSHQEPFSMVVGECCAEK